MYPLTLTLSELDATHPTYDEFKRVWNTIDDLVTGGYRIEAKKNEYIVPRPDESPMLYALRLKKFVYTPVLGDALKEYATKITNAPFNVNNAETDRWQQFRKATDGKRRDERELLNAEFRTLITYGRSWTFVDKTESNGAQPQTKLQEESLNLRTRVVIFNPLQVINWGFNTNDDIQFVKVRQITTETSPFGASRHKATWTLIDETSVVKYEAFVNLDANGNIASVIDPAPASNVELNLPYGGTRDRVDLTSTVNHNVGRCPVIYRELDPELWSGNAAYLKALQHLNIENSWTDTATIAGYIQRVFKPTKKEPDSDPNFSYSDDDRDIEQIKSSNQHLLIGDDFKFAEASGASLKVISESVLDKIEHQIKNIVNLGNVSATKGALEQSGASKQIDFTSLNDTMRRYGSFLTHWYTDVLRLVAVHLGERNTTNIEVTGFDTFDVDTLGNIIDQSAKILPYESKLPDTARRLWWLKVAETMHSTVNAQTKETIRREAESMVLDEPEPESPSIVGQKKQNSKKPTSK